MCFPEDEIIKQGDDGMNLYFLEKGSVLVYIENDNHVKRFVKELKIGSMFGEISLVYDCKRTASILSKNYCTCSNLEK